MTETRRLRAALEALEKSIEADEAFHGYFSALTHAKLDDLSALLSEPQAAQEPQENVKHRGDLVRLVKRLRQFEHLDDAVNVAASAFKDTVAAVRAAASPVLPAPPEADKRSGDR